MTESGLSMEKLSLTGTGKHDTPDELSTLSAIVIDGETIAVDNAAIHGKGKFERKITFQRKVEDVPNGRRIELIWVTLRKRDGALGYSGVGGSSVLIDDEQGVGYKNLADQVNKMDGAMKGRIMLDDMPEQERDRLLVYMRDLRPELWEHANPELTKQLKG